MLKDLLKACRSYRGYDESYRFTEEELMELVDHTRYAASSMNIQPLKFYLAWEKEEVDRIQRVCNDCTFPDRHFNRKCRSYDLLLCDVRLDLVIHCMIKSAFHPVTKLRYGIISEFFHKLFYLLLHSSSAPFLIDLFLSYNKAILLV